MMRRVALLLTLIFTIAPGLARGRRARRLPDRGGSSDTLAATAPRTGAERIALLVGKPTRDDGGRDTGSLVSLRPTAAIAGCTPWW